MVWGPPPDMDNTDRLVDELTIVFKEMMIADGIRAWENLDIEENDEDARGM